MRFKTAILGGAAALLLGTGLTGVALAEAPSPSATPRPTKVSTSPTVVPSASPVDSTRKAVCKIKEKTPTPCPAVPRAAEPSYTG
jgi:hypothetical protein